RLDLDQPAIAAHDDVHVHVRGRVLAVVQVEERLAADDPNRDCADTLHRSRKSLALRGAGERDPGAADSGRPCPAVRLDDVAVEPDRPLAELLEVVGGAEGATDEALDLHSAAALAAGAGLARGALPGRGRKHPVLGGHPAASAPDEPAR